MKARIVRLEVFGTVRPRWRCWRTESAGRVRRLGRQSRTPRRRRVRQGDGRRGVRNRRGWWRRCGRSRRVCVGRRRRPRMNRPRAMATMVAAEVAVVKASLSWGEGDGRDGVTFTRLRPAACGDSFGGQLRYRTRLLTLARREDNGSGKGTFRTRAIEQSIPGGPSNSECPLDRCV